ncbi:hypothetical protein HPB50_014596 [Hyalomma asiaticum]|uniref:Uncharacterized protein n=1 Tax=Hyalomma asiaticum TaxID=266040 RepID=A0ACB7T100_HYAAI|nr:hypothetical protein HPB50_014596 [Hyalomma asiaticum]
MAEGTRELEGREGQPDESPTTRSGTDDGGGGRLQRNASGGVRGGERNLTTKRVQSLPTYETKYSMSWIDVTLAAPSVIAGGYSWRVRDDVTHSEHGYIKVTVGDSVREKRKRLTRFAREELVLSLSRDPWFTQVTGTELRSAEALDAVVEKFYTVFSRHYQKSFRPAHKVARGNPWWSPELAQERKRVNAMRRRYQREAFGRTRTELVLPPLVCADGSRTATHLESATLLLRTQVAVDDPAEEAHRSFSTAVHNDDLSATEKFNYLSTLVTGAAAAAICGLQATG